MFSTNEEASYKEASIPDITFCTLWFCLYLRTFSFFPFFLPSCLLPSSFLPPAVLSLFFLSFFDKETSSKYLASFLWPPFVRRRLPGSDHSILLSEPWSSLVLQTSDLQRTLLFGSTLGSVASGCFRETSGTIFIKRSLSSRDHGPENWDYPILTYTFQTLPALWRWHELVFIPKGVSLNTVSKVRAVLSGGAGFCGPALCYIKKSVFPFLLLSAFNMWMCIKNIKRRKEHLFDQHHALSILKLPKKIEKDCNFLHSLRILKCFFVQYILLLLAASFIMWVRVNFGMGLRRGKRRQTRPVVAMLPSWKATIVEVCNKLEMLGTVSVTGKDSLN